MFISQSRAVWVFGGKRVSCLHGAGSEYIQMVVAGSVDVGKCWAMPGARNELIHRLLSGPRTHAIPCIVPYHLTYLGLGRE